MASVSLERIMDRVSLVFDCSTDEEATQLYNMLASQALDGKSFRLDMSSEQGAEAEREEQVRRPSSAEPPPKGST